MSYGCDNLMTVPTVRLSQNGPETTFDCSLSGLLIAFNCNPERLVYASVCLIPLESVYSSTSAYCGVSGNLLASSTVIVLYPPAALLILFTIHYGFNDVFCNICEYIFGYIEGYPAIVNCTPILPKVLLFIW